MPIKCHNCSFPNADNAIICRMCEKPLRRMDSHLFDNKADINEKSKDIDNNPILEKKPLLPDEQQQIPITEKPLDQQTDKEELTPNDEQPPQMAAKLLQNLQKLQNKPQPVSNEKRHDEQQDEVRRVKEQLNNMIREELRKKFNSISKPLCPTCNTALKSMDETCPNCGTDNHKVSQKIGMEVIEQFKQMQKSKETPPPPPPPPKPKADYPPITPIINKEEKEIPPPIVQQKPFVTPNEKELNKSDSRKIPRGPSPEPSKQAEEDWAKYSLQIDHEIVPQKLSINVGQIFVASSGSDYQIKQRIGGGGFGSVYLASDKQGNLVALKVLHLWEKDPIYHSELVTRFKREYNTGQLDSPYIVKNIDSGTLNGNPFIIMQYCSGGSLRNHIKQIRSETELIHLAIDILQGLIILHRNGVAHRDLKPENILFDEKGRAVLSDFGLAGFTDNRSTVVGNDGKPNPLWGTIEYMPIERLGNRSNDEKGAPTDIYSLGVLLYEASTQGNMPYGRAEKDIVKIMQRMLNGEWTPISTYRNDLSDNWANVIKKCIAPSAKDRYQTAEGVLNDLYDMTKPSIEPQQNLQDRATQLLIIKGSDMGTVIDLDQLALQKNKSMLTLGLFNPAMPDTNDIELVEFMRFISTRHATLELINSEWHIKDGQFYMKRGQYAWQNSRNGIIVNDIKLDNATAHCLKKGDILTIGDTKLQVQ
jgi:serine/threonine protein kinase